MALGQMAANKRFPRSSVVFLDGDQSSAIGCKILPGDDAPEIVVFESLQEIGWPGIPEKISRKPSESIDALNNAMTNTDHHDWIEYAANSLNIGGEILWHALCTSWAVNCLNETSRDAVVQPIVDAMEE